MLRRPTPLAAEHGEFPPSVPPSPELYLKPDDRWEMNEIASRAPGVADRLLAVMDAALQAPGSAPAPAPVPLDEDLLAHRH
jgi:hypothetical protein